MKRTSAFRRFQERKHKKHAQNILKNVFLDKEAANDEKQIGIFAHSPAGCSCPMCGNPRNQRFKLKEKLTIAEQKADIDFKEELNMKGKQNE